jgi:hypothetical protein
MAATMPASMAALEKNEWRGVESAEAHGCVRKVQMRRPAPASSLDAASVSSRQARCPCFESDVSNSKFEKSVLANVL